MVAKGARLSYIIYLISSIFKCKFFQSTQSLGVKWQAHMLHRSLPKYPINFFNTCFAVTFVSPTYQTKVTRCLIYMLQNTFFLLTVPSTSNSLRWLYVPSSLGVFPSLHPLVCTPALGGSQKAEPTVRETRCLRAQGHKSREESSFILSLLATSCCQYAEGSENSLYCWWSISDSHWDRPYRSKFHSFGSWRQHQDNYLASLIYVTKANQALSLGVSFGVPEGSSIIIYVTAEVWRTTIRIKKNGEHYVHPHRTSSSPTSSSSRFIEVQNSTSGALIYWESMRKQAAREQ